MMTQTQISDLIGMHQSDVSRILNGKKPVSWPLSQKLATIFPGKDVVAWKNATSEELKKAFSQLELEKEPV